MVNSNTGYIVESIVDIIIDSMKPRFESKVPAATFGTVRSGAVLTVKNAIPFPLRMAINIVPKKHLEALQTKIKTAIKTDIANINTDFAIEPIVDNIVNSLKSLVGNKVPAAAFDTVRSGIVLAVNNAILSPLRAAINTKSKEEMMIPLDTAIEDTISIEKVVTDSSQETNPDQNTDLANKKQKVKVMWYYYNENNKQVGPFTNKEFKQLARQGTITPETFVEDENGNKAYAKNVNRLTFSKNIFEAAAQGTVEDVKYFVETKSTDVNAKNEDNDTPLHFAVQNPCVGVLEYLVAQGAGVNAKNRYGQAPLHRVAAGYSNVDIIAVMEYLISEGANVNVKDHDGWTPLRHVAGWNCKVEVFQCLISHGADVNAKDNAGNTVLHVAAMDNSNVDVLKYLISKDADIQAINNDGATPLDFAEFAKDKTEEKKRILREAMAKRPIPPSSIASSYQSRFPHIFDAAQEGTIEDVRYFIETQGTDINTRAISSDNTPLHFAAGWNLNVEVLQYLVSQGADVNAKNCVGNTPLYFAARINSVDVLHILISHGANVNAKCSEWYTPLHGAADYNSNIEVLKYLISQGADVNAKAGPFGFGVFGQTPLDVASTEEKKRILREAGTKSGVKIFQMPNGQSITETSDEERLAAAKARLKRECIVMAIGGAVTMMFCSGPIMADANNLVEGFVGFLLAVYLGIGFGAWFGVIKTVGSRIYHFLIHGSSWRFVQDISENPGGACLIGLIALSTAPIWLALIFAVLWLVCPIVAIYRCVQHYKYIQLCGENPLDMFRSGGESATSADFLTAPKSQPFSVEERREEVYFNQRGANMKISKFQLCSQCRKIQMADGISIESFLESKGYDLPYERFMVNIFMGNQIILAHLRDKGGCPACINLLERAVQ